MLWIKKIKSSEAPAKDKKATALSRWQIVSIILTVVFVIGLWFLNYYTLNDQLGKENINDRGTFGDMFGAVNALFSGLAFAGIIWTILLQRNELRLQREDSKLSREEAIDQNYTLKLQRFENTFFNMLNLQNEIVKNLKLGAAESRQVIEEAQNDLFCFLSVENFAKHHRQTHIQPQPNSLTITPQSPSNAQSLLNKFYHEKFYNKYASSFNHYFRHLYHIFKFIYFSELDRAQKNFYATITRAQLSQGELYLIAFNMLIDGYGRPYMLYLVKEYDILQNMDWTRVTPDVFRELIEIELQNVSYPFDLDKPKEHNLTSA